MIVSGVQLSLFVRVHGMGWQVKGFICQITRIVVFSRNLTHYLI